VYFSVKGFPILNAYPVQKRNYGGPGIKIKIKHMVLMLYVL